MESTATTNLKMVFNLIKISRISKHFECAFERPTWYTHQRTTIPLFCSTSVLFTTSHTLRIAYSFFNWASCFVGNLSLSITLIATSLPLSRCTPRTNIVQDHSLLPCLLHVSFISDYSMSVLYLITPCLFYTWLLHVCFIHNSCMSVVPDSCMFVLYLITAYLLYTWELHVCFIPDSWMSVVLDSCMCVVPDSCMSVVLESCTSVAPDSCTSVVPDSCTSVVPDNWMSVVPAHYLSVLPSNWVETYKNVKPWKTTLN